MDPCETSALSALSSFGTNLGPNSAAQPEKNDGIDKSSDDDVYDGDYDIDDRNDGNNNDANEQDDEKSTINPSDINKSSDNEVHEEVQDGDYDIDDRNDGNNNDSKQEDDEKSRIKASEQEKECDDDGQIIRVVCISDTHNGHSHLTEELISLKKKGCFNILVHSGDMTDGGHYGEFKSVMKWFEKLGFDCTLCIGGNMDGIGLDNKSYNFSGEPALDGHSLLTNESKNIYYLENESIIIEGIKFYGLPHTPKFFGGFQLSSEKEYKSVYGNIDDDTDILISHGPIYNVLDKTSSGRHVGCKRLRKYVLEKIKPSAMIFGHVHPSHGKKIDKTNNILFLNCAMHDKIHAGTDRQKDNSYMSPIIMEINKKDQKFYLVTEEARSECVSE